MNILLSSVGRRPYLVRWFQEALTANGLKGSVIAADSDDIAPARSFADGFVRAPLVREPEYQSWLANVLDQYEIELAVSINDFELSEWALLEPKKEWSSLVRLEPVVQALVEDKFAMGKSFQSFGLPTPKTWVGSNALEEIEEEGEYVTKGRFGSASRGLRFANWAKLGSAIEEGTSEVTNRQGNLATDQEDVPPEDLLIVQERIDGTEYGLDVVCDLDGRFAGVLARRKIAMRSGETDRAESVAPSLFEDIARGITEVVPHSGTIDVDVIVDSNGTAFVIDVNPRFGGGYPFSHLAGARIPNAYVAWATGRPISPEWLRYEAGVISGKCMDTVRIP